MDTGLIAAVATFRVFSSRASTSPNLTTPDLPPSRQDRMATTPVCEGPLLLSKLATNEITYLQVNNFTRAIMPRSRIWRVSESEIVIPATSSNYWLITLKGSPRSIEKFTRVISGLCRYERFYEKGNTDEIDITEEQTDGDGEYVSSTPSFESQNVLDARQTIKRGNMARRLNTLSSMNKEHRPKLDKEIVGDVTHHSSGSTSSTLWDSSHSDSEHTTFVESGKNNFLEPIYVAEKNEQHFETPLKPKSGDLISSPIVSVPSTPVLMSSPKDAEPGIQKCHTESPPERDETQSQAESDTDYDSLETVDLTFDTSGQETEDKVPADSKPTYPSFESRFAPRFSHPLIPSSHVIRYYPSFPSVSYVPPPNNDSLSSGGISSNAIASNPHSVHRLVPRRRELLNLGPSSLHQDVTSVGGYIGMIAVKGIMRKT